MLQETGLRADWTSDLRRKAKSAIAKTAPYGPDLQVEKFALKSSEHPQIEEVSSLPALVMDTSRRVGIVPDDAERSGTYFQLDASPILKKSGIDGLKVTSLESAFDEVDLRNYYWKAVSVDKDKFTAAVELYGKGGYVIIAEKGIQVDFPIQACLFLDSPNLLQAPHNIIIAEEGSSVNIITGCTISPERTGLHIGISEFYIKKNAKVSFTMIHGWGEGTHVRPRTGVIVEEGATFITHYINVNPLASIQMYPSVTLVGKGARTTMSSVLVGLKNSYMDVGSEIIFQNRETAGEIVSKSISKDSSNIVARGRLVGNSDLVKGHLECRGLILSPESRIAAVPELEGNAKEVELTHEAAVGKLAEEEIYYLMSKGFSRDEATSTLIRGFMEVKVAGLPSHLESIIRSVNDTVAGKL